MSQFVFECFYEPKSSESFSVGNRKTYPFRPWLCGYCVRVFSGGSNSDNIRATGKLKPESGVGCPMDSSVSADESSSATSEVRVTRFTAGNARRYIKGIDFATTDMGSAGLGLSVQVIR